MSSWTGAAEAYRRSFGTLCAGPVDRMLADLPEGRHLDVGCGPGVLARRAVDRGRAVVAVDSDPGMVALSSTAVPGRTVRAELPALPFGDGVFDAVTANFVVNHVGDPRATVRELARVLGPGGSVALTVWPAGPTAWARLVATAFTAAGVDPPVGRPLPSDLDFDRSVVGLSSLVTDAGLAVSAATQLGWDWEVDPDDLWAGVTGGVATAGRAYRSHPRSVRLRIDDAFRSAARAATHDGLLRLPSVAAYVVAGRGARSS
ncbi:class I SAM-dependent methyltransferase [Phycicoccus sonneratiae]|uniref:Class I SAM-dependent methyltransferase n=1 Tax=Phycicoccus sonneratiae TaxID=2807628 RepID=A0ABS2CMI2_9MICO|nr:class I SAM-dependent methyltransferase [Phycicoccus sonneraticus]MBM6401073.1 class I SAM-dependent methyltransferase [Phycicoccus sonneraticus]